MKPSPGGVINVLLGFAKTIPSRIIPIPNLLALPSKPIETTIFQFILYIFRKADSEVKKHQIPQTLRDVTT